MSHTENQQFDCCPPFDPVPWDDKSFIWKDKLFIKDTMRVFLHMPWPPSIAKLMLKMWNLAKDTDAAPEINDFLILATDPTPWKTEYYMAVTKEIPGADNVKLSGNFLTKVFDGPYNSVPKWIKIMEQYAASKGKKIKRHYFHYTTCPKCAKKYGHNYVVAFTETE